MTATLERSLGKSRFHRFYISRPGFPIPSPISPKIPILLITDRSVSMQLRSEFDRMGKTLLRGVFQVCVTVRTTSAQPEIRSRTRITIKRRQDLPLDHGGAPSQARAEDDHQHQIAPLDALGLHGFIQRNRHRGCGSVAVLFQIDE
jgi:hypothetical protein